MAEAPAADVAAPAAPADKVALVNTGRGDMVILEGPNGVLEKNSGNTLLVPIALAGRLRRAFPQIKRVSDIFKDTDNTVELKAEREALKAQVAKLEALLAAAQKNGQSEGAAVALKDAQDGRAIAEAKVADLTSRLQDFIAVQGKKDLEALQAKHADAVPAREEAAAAA